MWGRITNKRDYSKTARGTIIKGLYEIEMNDCYAVKEQLKALGYKWDYPRNAWCLTCTAAEIGNAIADVVVAINLPLGEYQQMALSLCDIDIDMAAVTMDDEHTAMLTAHYTN